MPPADHALGSTCARPPLRSHPVAGPASACERGTCSGTAPLTRSKQARPVVAKRRSSSVDRRSRHLTGRRDGGLPGTETAERNRIRRDGWCLRRAGWRKRHPHASQRQVTGPWGRTGGHLSGAGDRRPEPAALEQTDPDRTNFDGLSNRRCLFRPVGGNDVQREADTLPLAIQRREARGHGPLGRLNPHAYEKGGIRHGHCTRRGTRHTHDRVLRNWPRDGPCARAPLALESPRRLVHGPGPVRAVRSRGFERSHALSAPRPRSSQNWSLAASTGWRDLNARLRRASPADPPP